MRHMRLGDLLSFIGLASLTFASPLAKREIQYSPNREKAEAVKAAFRRSWDGYMQQAFPHDTLRPVSGGWADDRNGWGASAVDAFGTAIVMDEQAIVKQILDFVPTIDFDKTSSEISLFETTIRYLGGLVSAYDLLTEPNGKHATGNETLVKAVLSQAERLATNLKFAFDTPSGIPDNSVYFNPSRRAGSQTNGIATIGTLQLEWTRLADLTGNPVFSELALKANSYLLDPKPALGEPFPGLLGTNVNITTGLFTDGNGGWGGGTDSFYEYLIKMYLYDPDRFGQYKDRWVLAADSSITYMASHPSTRPDLTFLAEWRNTSLRYISQHLACFDGGNFILGGLTLQNQKYIDFGLALTNACHETYIQTATGIGPEVFRWQDASAANSSTNPPPPADLQEFYKRAGFWIPPSSDIGGASIYQLRPEVIESFYYAYRATGDTKYQDWAWEAFLSINRTCAAGTAYSSINDVNAPGGGGSMDFQESFWFAETMKYSYLIHAEDAPWQVKADRTNGWVFNTEAHPMKVHGRPG
ncbi:hypothetical protein MCOR25_002026 [Pyricularia grisea]|uniref:alpha-1,2-Mannosidase n=1 Tax=Pyricularia grisea TaxID=148305 RepID=A0A6P8AV34_PYRGI|nr:uncharacterized protein PgNI_08252 [Pyricularia grisea]KAI6379443.1 hypothetical protein MCOR25_002026 [Pyricularia grisea]TLD06077.1 hypothetical protein PgNI_08252 [Pyricularia grisea]